MKKLALVFAVASFVTFSCNQAPKEVEATPEQTEVPVAETSAPDTNMVAAPDTTAPAAH